MPDLDFAGLERFLSSPMHDPRIDQLAEKLVSYSTHLEPGEKVLLDLQDTPPAVGVALIRAVRSKGAIPFIRNHHGDISREMLMGATTEQYDLLSELLLLEMKSMDAFIAVRGSNNIANTSDVPPEQMKLVMKAMREVTTHRVKQTKWCVLRWPNASMAQQAGMSTEAFEDFVFDVCLLDYEALLPGMEALKDLMEATDGVRIVNEGTDLTFSIKDIPAVICAGNYNIPDGEVFTAPVKNSVEGVIRHNAPTIYQGTPFDEIELHFEKGKIVKATAGAKTDKLNEILDSDEGSRYIGEFAIGFHPKIKEPMRDILFDEKIAGSFHFTPGEAYEEADNGNRSQVHWDMVTIQRPEYGGGEIHFDGVLIRKDGQFLADELKMLNW